MVAICASFRASSLIGSRDTRTAVAKGGNKKVVECNGNLNKKQSLLNILASVEQQC